MTFERPLLDHVEAAGPPSGAPLLEAVDIHKRYGHNEVLRGVTFAVQRRDVRAVLGPSGSGKSTMLRCLALPEPELARQRSEIGMVFQRFNLFPHMTALQNVMIGLTEVRQRSKSEARETAADMLARVGLAGRATFYPSELSGGQQQRVAIARALVMNPKVMLFDEPTSALDPELVGEVLTVMEELAREGMTMIVVTHEVGFARRAASLVTMIDEGQIVEDAPPDEFFSHPRHERTRRFLEAVL
jgi:polar amino acid transport system ATP-binding protein